MYYLSNKKIAQILREIRISKNYSQAHVSKGICSQSSLSKYENGEKMPSFQKTMMILKKLDITIEEFESILFNKSIEYKAGQLFNAYIKNFDIPSLRKCNIVKNNCQLFPYFANWLKYCLNIKIKHNQKIDFSYMTELLNQDTFYNNDFEQLIYGFSTLPYKSIEYNFKRIYQNMLDKNIHYYKPWLFIDLLITIGCVSYYDKNIDIAIFYWKKALYQAKETWNIQRMRYIILLLNNNKIILAEKYNQLQ